MQKRTITIELEHPTTPDSMSGGWCEAHKSKSPTKQEINSELESHLYELGFDVHKITIKQKGYNIDKEVNGHLYIANDNLKRIADALDEILRLVKKDMEKYEEKNKK